jgi:phosphoribosylformylglycinamidine synthase
MKLKLYKKIDENIFIKYSINYLNDCKNKNKLFSLFQTNLQKLKHPKNLIEFEIKTISKITPWVSNIMKICEKSNYKFIKNISKSYVYLVKDYQEGVKLFYQNHDRMTERYSENYDIENTSFEEENLDINYLDKKYGLSLTDIDKTYFTENLKNISNPLFVLLDLSQSNSEHCRHHFFNGKIYLDGIDTGKTLFELVKQPLSNKKNKDFSLVAFSDNSSVIEGYSVTNYFPFSKNIYTPEKIKYNFVLTAETHNFPTGIAPFQGAATGIGGRIRDVQATGIGAIPICSVAGYSVGDIHADVIEYPDNMAKPRDILLKASDGSSDYGNKFGEPIVLGFTRSFRNDERQRIEWVKPIMFSAGLGLIRDEHNYKKEIKEGMLICKIGGPAYKIGLGGGSASSRISDKKNSELDFSAVQRDDPEMEQKMNKVLRHFSYMGNENPIISIHDQGAGGNGNVLKEIIEDKGAIIDIGKITLGDTTMNDIEIWLSEYQESNAILIKENKLSIVQQICDRENVQLDIVGHITGNGKLDIYNGDKCIIKDYPMNINKDKREYFGKTKEFMYEEFKCHKTFEECLDLVLNDIAVSSKRFLTNKVDRSVTGLIAQQQCVGPIHTPLSNYAIFASSFLDKCGCATSVGEQPISGMVSPISMVQKTFCEMITNLMFVVIDDVEKISCSANWMWPCPNKYPEETYKMYIAMKELSDICQEFGVIIDGGKDSLSMAVKYNENIIKCPGTLVLTSYACCQDIEMKVTPELKRAGNKLYYIDLSDGEMNMGGSILSSKIGKLYTEPVCFENFKLLKDTFILVQNLIREGKIVSGHDKSDGGLITTILEMAFAGNLGLKINLDENNIIKYLFNEEIGIVVESEYDLMHLAYNNKFFIKEIGEVIFENSIIIKNKEEIILRNKMTRLRKLWEHQSYELEKLQCSEVLATDEYLSLWKYQNPKYNILERHRILNGLDKLTGRNYNIGIIREEGSNGDYEMSCAFTLGRNIVTDINTYDLINDPGLLDEFEILVFVGGFSFADVLGSSQGWYNVIKNNKSVWRQFDRFYKRKNTYSLGVCNGCQLMVKLGWLGEGIKMEKNLSGRFESRYPSVKVEKNNTLFLKNLDELVCGIWSAHGEGRFVIEEDKLREMEENNQIVMRYVDYNMKTTERYPYNPNGSKYGIAGICSKDGRHLAMMPHPERSFKRFQMPWYPCKIEEYTPWFNIFKIN